MQNYIQKGDALNATAPAGGVVSGQGLPIGKVFGVAGATAAAGQPFVLHRRGMYTLPKTNAQAWGQGDSLYWDAANAVVTNVNTGSLLPVGWAGAPAASPSSVGSVLLGQAPS